MTRFGMAALLAATALGASASVAQAQAEAGPAGQAVESQAQDRPNVLVWILDDVGFAQFSSYGGLVQTPNIDRVAAMGLQFSNYYTAPICSASRAALLTGRNPHSVEMGGHALITFPNAGYRGAIPADAGTLAANLSQGGYATFAVGKWDHLPSTDITPSGPFTYWPLGQGFDRYYGFLAAEADQWSPVLVQDNSPIPMREEPGYHLSVDLADEAIAMIDAAGASEEDQPFFLYYATGIAHAPHHAPQDWIDRYRGSFDMGWDAAREIILERQIARGLAPEGTVLAPRPQGMDPWDSLTQDQQRLYARQMEVFAASVSHADAEFGRILDHLEASGELENTIIIITSDNGASAEGSDHGTYNEDLFLNRNHPTVEENLRFFDQWGGPETFPHYALGWAVAGNTPFRYFKQVAHGGGTRVPLVVAWPQGIGARGELRDQFVYVTDIAPTLLELTGTPLAPVVNNVAQRPLEGLSFSYAIDDAQAADRKHAQYIELFGNKGLWSDGWTIVTSHRVRTGETGALRPIDDPWELYDVRTDPGQTTDLAARYPERVAALAALYDEQIERYNAQSVSLPSFMQIQMGRDMAEFARRGGVWSYSGPVSLLSERAGPPIHLRPFRASIELELMTGDETGPVFALGGKLGGMGLHLADGVPTFTFRGFDGSAVSVSSPQALPVGESTLEVTINRTRVPTLAPQDIGVTISRNGEPLVSGTVSYGMPDTFGITKTFEIGIDLGDSVSDDYEADVPFPGRIGRSTFDFNMQN